MPSANSRIGVFDSGVGGLTVVREIFRQLPGEEVIYFGDTGRFPYGTRSPEVIQKFSMQAANFLMEQDIKILVVACNTASSFALVPLKHRFDPLPILGVIEPGARKGVESTKNGKIGVIGTEATVNSNAYLLAILRLAGNFWLEPKIKVFSYPCPLFVALAEEGYIDKKASYLIAEEYLCPLKRKKIDTLILGCTHYPLLKPVIQKVMGPKVKLVDAAQSVAQEVKRLLVRTHDSGTGSNPPKHRFYVSDQPEKFVKISQRFLRTRIPLAQKIDINRY